MPSGASREGIGRGGGAPRQSKKMITGIIGKKVGMTQIFEADGTVSPATVVKAGPCVVVQMKTAQTDGYEAVQIGLVEEKPLKANKATACLELKVKAGGEPVKPGDPISVSMFADGERVDVIGTSRGKGFQGVVKRHHFAGGRATHGSMFHRAPGSIGASSYPSRVVKGMRAAGRMGCGRTTIHNLKVLRVDPDNHLLIVEGGIPGAPTGYVIIRKAVAAKKIKVAQVEKPKKGKK